jgi:signal peptidase I
MEFYQYEETNNIRRAVNWIVQTAVVISLAWFCVFAYGTGAVNTGQGMQPVIGNGEVSLQDRILYHFKNPARYDVIVFRNRDGKNNIKRIIGLPGETVQIKDGKVLIDGKVPEGRESGAVPISIAGLASEPVKLTQNEYFVLGDNRDASEDSRFESVGNIKREQIAGKLWVRISPVIRFGLIR